MEQEIKSEFSHVYTKILNVHEREIKLLSTVDKLAAICESLEERIKILEAKK